MVLYSSWTHGSSALLERVGSPDAIDKYSVSDAFKGDFGDIVDLGLYSSVACLRMGWGSRFVVVDTGLSDYPRSGSFWCRYAIPTPVIEAGKRIKADKVLINYETQNPQKLNIEAVTVWDGNKRIFVEDNIHSIASTKGDDEYDGGISKRTTNSQASFDLSRLFSRNIIDRDVYFGLAVSIKIRAQDAKDNYLEIRSVGVDFDLPG